MTIKRYKLIEDIEFSLGLDEAIIFDDAGRKTKTHLHIVVMIYYDGRTTLMSIYIPRSDIVNKEEYKITKSNGEYVPSKEFIHIIRATLLMVIKKWERKPESRFGDKNSNMLMDKVCKKKDTR